MAVGGDIAIGAFGDIEPALGVQAFRQGLGKRGRHVLHDKDRHFDFVAQGRKDLRQGLGPPG